MLRETVYFNLMLKGKLWKNRLRSGYEELYAKNNLDFSYG